MRIGKECALMLKKISLNPTLKKEEKQVLEAIYKKACIENAKWSDYMKKRRNENDKIKKRN